MRLAIFLVCLLTPISAGAAQQMSIGTITQKGTCVVAGVQGNVTINCPGLDPSVVRILNEQFKAQLKDRDLRIDEITKDANDWKDKYLGLLKRLEDASVSDGLTRKAEELLKAGKLDEAGHVLDQVLASGEKQVDQIAKNHFDRATLYELQFQPLQALLHYEKAYSYRATNPDYGQAYANLLYEQRNFIKAEPIYKDVLEIRREQAKANPAAYLPDVATTLNNLGVLYRNTQRLKESADAYTEALQIRRELAKANPAAYLPDVAGTLNNLGNLHKAEGQNIEAAAQFCNEAAVIFKQLSVDNPARFGPALTSVCTVQ